ncbi:glycosyltransferase family 2 protein [Roseinatronobacter sp.]|uniref:glycosyltransferase family 2 protein n=1 Tax=Roseinatronobacter sp. TaxID=1945755 RepID=UPI0026001B05|nr:glycosyltransferase family 2 protein [Roseibaca sp.]
MTRADLTDTPPKVSVILPCYNVAGYVRTTIESLKAQAFQDFEVLVVDDGSTDNTAQTARDVIAQDARFRVVLQLNQGLSAARNTGLNLARGAYIAFVDGDDWVAPNFLLRLVTTLNETQADWAACAIWLEFDTGARAMHSAIHAAPEIMGEIRPCELDDARLVARQFPSAWNKLYRRDFIGDLRFVTGALYEDHPFYWALACRSEQMWYLPEPLYHHRRGRPGQITMQGSWQIFQQFDRLDEVRRLLSDAPMRHRKTALSRLATRLVHERLEPVTDAALRQAFIDKAREYFAAHALSWDWDDATDIDLRPAAEISPALRFTVLVQAGAGAEQTHHALAAQRLSPEHVLEVPNGPAPEVLRKMWPRIETDWCAILKAGDTPSPDWSAKMMHALQNTEGATFAVCAATHHPQGFDPGFALPDLPCADLAALMLSTKANQPTDLDSADWAAALQFGAALAPNQAARVTATVLSLGPRAPETPRAALRALQRLLSYGELTRTQAAAVFAHRAQLAVLAQSGRGRRIMHALHWGMVRRLGRFPKPPAAPHIGESLHQLL